MGGQCSIESAKVARTFFFFKPVSGLLLSPAFESLNSFSLQVSSEPTRISSEIDDQGRRGSYVGKACPREGGPAYILQEGENQLP